MSDTAAQRQSLHTIRELVDTALMVDSDPSSAKPCIAAILMECVKYVRASGTEYNIIAREIQHMAQRWANDGCVHVDMR